MVEHLTSFVMAIWGEKIPAIKVKVDRRLAANSMIVSPDVFQRMAQLGAMDMQNEFFAQALKDIAEIK